MRSGETETGRKILCVVWRHQKSIALVIRLWVDGCLRGKLAHEAHAALSSLWRRSKCRIKYIIAAVISDGKLQFRSYLSEKLFEVGDKVSDALYEKSYLYKLESDSDRR
jgi:hypothetical protein